MLEEEGSEEEAEFIDPSDLIVGGELSGHDESGAINKEEMEMEEDDEPSEDMIPNQSVQGFGGHSDAVYSVSLHPTIGNIAASGGGDDRAFLWNIENGNTIFEFLGHKDTVNNVKFNCDGTLLATGSYDATIKIWETQSGKLVHTLEGPGDAIEWISWHPKGNIILGGLNDSTCWMWNATNNLCMNVFSGHSGPLTCGSFSLDGKQVITGGSDATIRIWDPKTAVTKFTIQGNGFHDGPLTCLALHPTNTNLIMTGSEDFTGKVVNTATGKPLGSLGPHTDSVEAVGFCASLPRVATGSLDGTLKLWDLNTMKLQQTCQHEGGVIRLLWHQTQALVYTASLDKAIRLWDGRTGNCERKWTGHKESLLDISINKDGNIILSGSDDHTALVFQV